MRRNTGKRRGSLLLLALCLLFGLTACNAVTPGPSTTRSSAAAISATTAEETQAEPTNAQASGEGITEEESSLAVETTEEAAENRENLVYAISGVNVRDAASSNSNIMGTLSEGDAVVKLGEEGSWTKIEYNGAECYVYSEYLTETAP
ncbi:MAG: SH3 domain-containing protein [Lachnospiraceae bacterium]|nr:SH3 domain-containing protein [Lachnospiraceae bacterium]